MIPVPVKLVTVKLMVDTDVQAFGLINVTSESWGTTGSFINGSITWPLPAAILNRGAEDGKPASNGAKNILFFFPQFALSGPSNGLAPEYETL